MDRALIVLIGVSLLAISSVSRADDDVARAAVNQAFARQRALPAYVEHQRDRALGPDDGKPSRDDLTARVLTSELQQGGSHARTTTTITVTKPSNKPP